MWKRMDYGGTGIRGLREPLGGGHISHSLTRLVAHAAQDGTHLHPEVALTLCQALAYKAHHLIRGDVPSVEREREYMAVAAEEDWRGT